MASVLIHLAIGKKVNEKICKKEEPFLTGCIAPDLARYVGLSRDKSHFINKERKFELDRFLEKYNLYMNNDYVLGYYVHLFTDYLWYQYFTSNIVIDNYITRLDGKTYKVISDNMQKLYMYNDYSASNIDLIKYYDLDLEFLHKNEYYVNNIIEEVPYDKINVLIDLTVEILKKKNKRTSIVFDFDDIKQFIDIAVDLIIAHLKEKKLI